MTRALQPFFTFQNRQADEALALYESVFDDFELVSMNRYGPEAADAEGSVMAAAFRLAGQEFRCSDSPIEHNWDFTPAISMWVDCESDIELEDLFAKLGDGGQVFMPLADYGFSTRFGWVGDRFGITWQLNLE